MYMLSICLLWCKFQTTALKTVGAVVEMNSTIKCDGETDIRMRKDKLYVLLHFVLCGEGVG